MRYRVTNNRPGHGRKRINKDSIATLLAEYNHFYLFQGHAYRFCISKNALHCGHYSMEKAGSAK